MYSTLGYGFRGFGLGNSEIITINNGTALAKEVGIAASKAKALGLKQETIAMLLLSPVPFKELEVTKKRIPEDNVIFAKALIDARLSLMEAGKIEPINGFEERLQDVLFQHAEILAKRDEAMAGAVGDEVKEISAKFEGPLRESDSRLVEIAAKSLEYPKVLPKQAESVRPPVIDLTNIKPLIDLTNIKPQFCRRSGPCEFGTVLNEKTNCCESIFGLGPMDERDMFIGIPTPPQPAICTAQACPGGMSKNPFTCRCEPSILEPCDRECPPGLKPQYVTQYVTGHPRGGSRLVCECVKPFTFDKGPRPVPGTGFFDRYGRAAAGAAAVAAAAVGAYMFMGE